ncbi:helix-turn-helix transcriptional regulator [Caloramator proteoclasticus]|nr:helix-turn-helix domain-containing protein [Caloramator proteoclasticus]
MVKNRLKEIRMREYMMNQKVFAEFIEIDIKSLSNWERNISRPNLEIALKIAKKLNKKVEDIWYLED